MLMNFFQKHLSKFKQELASIVFLSAIQVWLNFNFPAFVRLGTPLSTIVSLSISVFSVLVYVYVFLYADTYVPRFNLAYLDDAPEPYRNTLKNLHRIGLITLALVSIVYLWYRDYYRMSNIWYVIMYAHQLLAFMLMVRAINRRTPDFDQK
jgi:hypothetical protein